jgi:GlpG protein
MRLIGHLSSEPGARLFGDFLLVCGIENAVEEDSPAGWGIWVAEEDKVDEAKSFLAEFCENPESAKFRESARGASSLRANKEKEQAAWEKKVTDRRAFLRQILVASVGPLTLALMVASVVGFTMVQVPGVLQSWARWLFISEYFGLGLPEVRHGQIWRLVTPIFLHFGFLHILFNLLWLRDLGSAMEHRLGTRYLAFLVLLLAIGSNLAQFFIGGSPNFGGMSGVVYGMLGYVWIRSKFDPACGLFLHPTTMIIMLIWFGLAFAGVLGNVANWAHAGGLVLGMGFGYLDAVRR